MRMIANENSIARPIKVGFNERLKKMFSSAARAAYGFLDVSKNICTTEHFERLGHYWAELDYCDQQIEYIESFFEKHDFKAAQAHLDLLKDLKDGRLRKVGHSPAIIHEINQVLTVVRNLDTGMLSSKWDAIEEAHGYDNVSKKYGAIESWICRKIGHDIMEDYNVFGRETHALFKDGLIEKVEEKFETRYGRKATNLEKEVLQKSAHKIETLTHYRKLSPEDFAKISGEMPDLSYFKKSSKPVRLDKYTEQFSKLMNRSQNKFYNPYVFARLNKKGKPEVIITAYGSKNMIGIDSNAYIRSVGRDPFTAETKFGDRIDNDSTRIGVRENVDTYDKYTDGTDHLFSNIDGLASLVNYKFPKTPLKRYLKSQSKMLKLITELGQGVINHHADSNVSGEKVLDAVPLLRQSFDLTTPLVLSPYLPRGLDPYKNMPDKSNPLITFFGTFYDHIENNIEKPKYDNLHILCHAYLEGVEEHAGPKTTDKIVNTIGYHPPMVLLNNLDVSKIELSF